MREVIHASLLLEVAHLRALVEMIEQELSS
jgi:hypothetical protein